MFLSRSSYFLLSLLSSFFPRSNPFGNWRQRWNRRHGNRFHISTVVIATIKLDDTFFSSLPPVLSIYARSSRRRTETRTDRAAPLVCTRRFPLAMSKDSKKFSISNRVDKTSETIKKRKRKEKNGTSEKMIEGEKV